MSRARSKTASPKAAKMAGIALLATLLATLLTLGAAYAERDDSSGGNGERGGRRGPPPEAFGACAALVEGDSCSFLNRCEKEVTGTCVTARNDELICRPADRGPHGHGGGRDRPEDENGDENGNDDS